MPYSSCGRGKGASYLVASRTGRHGQDRGRAPQRQVCVGVQQPIQVVRLCRADHARYEALLLPCARAVRARLGCLLTHHLLAQSYRVQGVKLRVLLAATQAFALSVMLG